MRSYTPFLKLKVNEVAAFAALNQSVQDRICPFFDLPRQKKTSEADFCVMVQKSARKMQKVFGNKRSFYLDCFDIPDSVTVAGDDKFGFIASEFSAMNFIPVVGIDRAPTHNAAVFAAKSAGLIQSSIFVVRLQEADFESFHVVESELWELFGSASAAGFGHMILVLDCRMCLQSDPADLAAKIENFLSTALGAMPVAFAIVTGSSIPPRIGEVCATLSDQDLRRIELDIYPSLASTFGSGIVGFGDYSIVSPLYSEPDIPPEAMRNVLAPKVLYSYENVHAIGRGGALKNHPRGDAQFNDIAAALIKRPYFRKAGYSFGEDYLVDAAGRSSGVTASSILKPTICAHITYMVSGHPLFI